MKVLHINCNYAGTALHRHMIKHLNDCKIESSVYVPVYQSKGVDVSTPGAEVILSQCFRKWHRVVFDYKQKRILRDIQLKCDVNQFDCIHAYTLFTDGNAARILSRIYNKPYVVAVRSTDVNLFLKKVFYLRGRGVKILRDAAAVFFLSEPYRKQVLEKYVPEEYRQEIYDKSYIVPNGIDDYWLDNCYTDKLTKLGDVQKQIAAKRLNIIFVGIIGNRKNPLATQEALQLLRQRGWNVHYTAIGKVQNQEVYEKMCAYPDTTHIEYQSKENLLAYYREHDLFVMPSHTETFGLVYSEAMSQGLPVLYTKGQGFDGQFPDGVVGYAIDDMDPSDIAEKIELAVMQYGSLVKNSLHSVEKFRWVDICAKYEEIYERIANV